ncbi:MAG TPA: asparagine synthase (glutamine-hydrolyzing) [Terriglobales bacterium]|jgi:asparagine synthase (glutamine-hydrolysing)|nr:asparagine synthase (glutamine-hydrolyzing) [Terriglobales bacterium]
MCGIAGVVSATRESNITEALVHHMCEQIVYRGPDDEGLYIADGAGLGMRRLSIIDLAGGHQPVFNEDRSAWIVYNGEVYNFPELRPELEKRGHRFYTKTDTEVIIHLYEEMGADCVTKLRGMFSLAIYDRTKRKLVLARDRLGKKPLHYALLKDKLYFASEIKSILAVAPELAEVNAQGLLEYLYYGYVPDPITAFTGIQKLPPGHLLEFENGEIKIRQYWDLPRYNTHRPKSEEECLEELESRLLEATRIRLISDVPLGAFLSGGTDSSTVVALMARASSGPVKTFSIGFTKDDFNEAQYARIVAQKFGTDHHEMILEPNVVETVEHLTSSLEEPFGDSSMLPTYYVSQMARQHVTVALSGDGGDELFAGYDRYRIHSNRRFFEHIPEWARRFYRDQLFRLMPRFMSGRKFSYNVTLPWRERYVDGLSFVPAFERDGPLLSDDFRQVLRRSDDPQNVMMRYFAQAPASDPVSELLYVDTKTYMVADILTKVDRMSMLNSLEVRVPMLDHEFVEWVTGLPPEWKLRGSTQKYILRKLAERVGVPLEALNRPKQGFALPLVHWMRNELKDVLMILLEPRTLQRGYFDADGIRKLMNDHLYGGKVFTGRIWRLLMFELWHRNFLEKFTKPAGLFSLPVMADSRVNVDPNPLMATAPAGE